MPHASQGGVSIHYVEHGRGDPVLLLMGLGGDHLWWERQIPAFSARHRTVLIDNRGMGASDKPEGKYTTAMMAEDARAVLDRLDIARTHVVGLSMGGMIAQELALAHPERVASLTLAATYARRSSGIERSAEQAATQAGAPSPLSLMKDDAKVDLRGVDVKQMFKFLMSLVVSPDFIKREKDWLKANFARSEVAGTTLDHFQAQVHAVLKHDTVSRLPSLRVPTLVLTGDSDLLVPPHHSDELASLIPGARLHKVPGGTHGFNVEMVEAFNTTVLDFIAAHPL
jgi:pimeloyl-ACP methyl ester carboxylesterase